jgi:hypothetical protein
LISKKRSFVFSKSFNILFLVIFEQVFSLAFESRGRYFDGVSQSINLGWENLLQLILIVMILFRILVNWHLESILLFTLHDHFEKLACRQIIYHSINHKLVCTFEFFLPCFCFMTFFWLKLHYLSVVKGFVHFSDFFLEKSIFFFCRSSNASLTKCVWPVLILFLESVFELSQSFPEFERIWIASNEPIVSFLFGLKIEYRKS